MTYQQQPQFQPNHGRGRIPWKRILIVLAATIVAFIVWALVSQEGTATPESAQSPTVQATPNQDATAQTAPDGVAKSTADQAQQAMEALLKSTPADSNSLGDTVEPGGIPVTKQLAQAEQDLTDALKQAYASPDDETLAQNVKDTYAVWEQTVWEVANTAVLVRINSSILSMSDEINAFNNTDGLPQACTAFAAKSGPEGIAPLKGGTQTDYERAVAWEREWHRLHSACTAALGPDMERVVEQGNQQ